MADGYGADRGTSFLALGWILTSIALCTVILRLYTRLLVTRSAGSDDVAIVFAAVLTIVGASSDSVQVHNGLGRHWAILSDAQHAQLSKWEYIVWITAFLSFFFIRNSVMLFTLRLMPVTKIWPQRAILVTFFLNFAITIIAVISYGVRCVPFTAIGNPANHWCESPKTIVATQRLNGILACLIDITTATIPAFLLWKIQIRRQTKILLDVIFLCGLITAALSIGRAASTMTGQYVVDNSWRIIPSAWFAMVEEKLGIIFASCPAIRQLFAHYAKTRSVRPSPRSQPSNEDLIKMRRHVNLHDIFWYSQPQSRLGSAFSGRPVYPPEEHINPEVKDMAQDAARKSPLDALRPTLRWIFTTRSAPQSRRGSAADAVDIEDAPLPLNRSRAKLWCSRKGSVPRFKRTDSDRNRPETASTIRNHGWPGLGDGQEVKRIARNYKAWGLPPQDVDQGSEGQSSTSFLRNDSDESLNSSDKPSSAGNTDAGRNGSLTRQSVPAPAVIRSGSGRRSLRARAAANNSRSPSGRPLGHIVEQYQTVEEEPASPAGSSRPTLAPPGTERADERIHTQEAQGNRTSSKIASSTAVAEEDALREQEDVDDSPDEEQDSNDAGLEQSIHSASVTSSARHQQAQASQQKARLISIPARHSGGPGPGPG